MSFSRLKLPDYINQQEFLAWLSSEKHPIVAANWSAVLTSSASVYSLELLEKLNQRCEEFMAWKKSQSNV